MDERENSLVHGFFLSKTRPLSSLSLSLKGDRRSHVTRFVLQLPSTRAKRRLESIHARRKYWASAALEYGIHREKRRSPTRQRKPRRKAIARLKHDIWKRKWTDSANDRARARPERAADALANRYIRPIISDLITPHRPAPIFQRCRCELNAPVGTASANSAVRTKNAYRSFVGTRSWRR